MNKVWYVFKKWNIIQHKKEMSNQARKRQEGNLDADD